MKTKRSDFLGVELDWFAVNSVGSVALMSSAGHGSVPDFVFDHFEAQQLIAQRLAALTGVSQGGDLIRSSRALSTIGVLTYNWRHWDGPYRRTEVPSQPAHLDTLGFRASLRDAFVRFPELQFQRARRVPNTDASPMIGVNSRRPMKSPNETVG